MVSSLVSTGRPNSTRMALYRPLQKMTYSVVAAVAILKVKRGQAGLAVSYQRSRKGSGRQKAFRGGEMKKKKIRLGYNGST